MYPCIKNRYQSCVFGYNESALMKFGLNNKSVDWFLKTFKNLTTINYCIPIKCAFKRMHCITQKYNWKFVENTLKNGLNSKWLIFLNYLSVLDVRHKIITIINW